MLKFLYKHSSHYLFTILTLNRMLNKQRNDKIRSTFRPLKAVNLESMLGFRPFFILDIMSNMTYISLNENKR